MINNSTDPHKSLTDYVLITWFSTWKDNFSTDLSKFQQILLILANWPKSTESVEILWEITWKVKVFEVLN